MFGKPVASGASEMLLSTIRRPVTSTRFWLTATKRSRRWKKSPRLKNEPLKENWKGSCEKPAVPTGVEPGTVTGAATGAGVEVLLFESEDEPDLPAVVDVSVDVSDEDPDEPDEPEAAELADAAGAGAGAAPAPLPTWMVRKSTLLRAAAELSWTISERTSSSAGTALPSRATSE